MTMPPLAPAPRPREQGRSLLLVALALVAAAATYYGLPAEVNELARRCAAIFVVAAIFWATEALPLYATSLCVLALMVIFLATDGGLAAELPRQSPWPVDEHGNPLRFTAQGVFRAFASPTIILFMGGFLLSQAIQKHGLDQVIASRMLRPFTGGPLRLILAVSFTAVVFSMWISNTATAAMMLAIIAPVMVRLGDEKQFTRALVLAAAFGANIGGLSTPISTPPNAVALAALREAGIGISFAEWMLLAIPLVILLALISSVMLWWFFPLKQPLGPALIERPGPMRPSAWWVLVVMACAIGLWVTGPWHGISEATVALMAAAALTALRLLDARDVDSINWNILLLMWGGLSLGQAMGETQLTGWLLSLPISQFSGFTLTLILVGLAVGLGLFMSNTATATLMVPVAMALTLGQVEAQQTLVIVIAFACSFGMATPVSTPPNAIAFATGRLTLESMLKAGSLITLLSVLALLIGYQLVIPLILRHG